jgi:hypothetical protein
MRRSLTTTRVAALALAVATLAGCSSAGPSDPTSGAEPTTIDELARVVEDEGAADSVTIREDHGDFGPELRVSLDYTETVEPETVSAAVTDLGPRIDEVLGDDRPEITMFDIAVTRDDEVAGSVTVTDEFAAEDVTRAVDIAQSSPCDTVRADVSAREGTTLTVLCTVADPEAVADAYEQAIALAPSPDVVDATTWFVGPDGVEWSVEATQAADGRGEALQSLVTEALASGVALLRVIDDGDAIAVSGIIDEASPAPCDAVVAVLEDASASGSVELRLPKGSGGGPGCDAIV